MSIFCGVVIFLTLIYGTIICMCIAHDTREKPAPTSSYVEEYAVDPTDDINATSIVEQGEDGIIIGGVAHGAPSTPSIMDTSPLGGAVPSLTIEKAEAQKALAVKQAEYRESADEIILDEAWSNVLPDVAITQDMIDPPPLENSVEMDITPCARREIRI